MFLPIRTRPTLRATMIESLWFPILFAVLGALMLGLVSLLTGAMPSSDTHFTTIH